MRWILPLCLLGACAPDERSPEETDPDSLERTPPRYGGCGDVMLYAGNVADTWRVDVNAWNLATDAATQGVPVELDLALPDASVLVAAYRGTAVSSASCVGAYPYPGPRIDESMDVIDGELRLRVTPDANATPSNPTGTAEVHLRNVVFAGASGQLYTIARMDWTADVGLLPP